MAGRPQRIDPSGRGSILRGWSQRKCMLKCGTVAPKAFSVVQRGSCGPARVGNELASMRSCPDPQRMSYALGPGHPLRKERQWEKRARTTNSGGWLLREAIKGDTLHRALNDLLTWSTKTLYVTSWLVSPAHSCACSYSNGSGPAIRPQTGDKG